MPNSKLVLAVLLAVAAVVFWWLGRPDPVATKPAETSTVRVEGPASGTNRSADGTPEKSAATVAIPSRRVEGEPSNGSPRVETLLEDPPVVPAAVEAAPRPAEEEAIQALRLSVRNYGQKFLGNPVGNNAEITAELNGGNARGIRYLEGQGAKINGKGELVDAWDTPYFFHQLSKLEMEIHSAGPDRKMGTSDDIVVK